MMVKGYIAFLDILGFSHLVSSNEFDTKLSGFLGIIRTAIEANAPSMAEFAIASDSIILTTTGSDLDNLRILLNIVSEIQYQALMEHDLAIRGGITFGDYLRENKEGNGILIAGRDIVAAYLLEKDQDWVGVSLSYTVIQKNPVLQNLFSLPHINTEQRANDYREAGYAPWTLLAVRYEEIPRHGDNHLSGYVVVPRPHSSIANPKNVQETLLRYRDKLKQLKPLAPNQAAQRKYQLAYNFIEILYYDFSSASGKSTPWAIFTKDL